MASATICGLWALRTGILTANPGSLQDCPECGSPVTLDDRAIPPHPREGNARRPCPAGGWAWSPSLAVRRGRMGQPVTYAPVAKPGRPHKAPHPLRGTLVMRFAALAVSHVRYALAAFGRSSSR